MRNGTNGAAGDRLREAERRLELWRLRCRGPGRIPKELSYVPQVMQSWATPSISPRKSTGTTATKIRI